MEEDGRTKTEIHAGNVTKALANKKIINVRTLIIEGSDWITMSKIKKEIREIEKMRGRRGTCEVRRSARKELNSNGSEKLDIYKEVSNLRCVDLCHLSFCVTSDFGGTNTNHHATRKVGNNRIF